MSADRDPKRLAKARLPFGETIRPGFAPQAGGIGAWLYVFAALGMGGLALYQMRNADLEISNIRVLLPIGAAVWLTVRAGMMFAAAYSARRDADEETAEEESKDP